MGMYTMRKHLTRFFVIDFGTLPSIETVPGPGDCKTQFDAHFANLEEIQRW